MVNRLRGLMNTVFYGTSASNYRDGLREQLNSKYSTTTSPFRSFVQKAGGLFTSYKTSIDTSHPVALRFNLLSNGYASHHFVLGVGYNGSQFALKDPDGRQNNTSITWVSWNNNQNKMSMIHTSFYF